MRAFSDPNVYNIAFLRVWSDRIGTTAVPPLVAGPAISYSHLTVTLESTSWRHPGIMTDTVAVKHVSSEVFPPYAANHHSVFAPKSPPPPPPPHQAAHYHDLKHY